jgi:hypothetical protein
MYGWRYFHKAALPRTPLRVELPRVRHIAHCWLHPATGRAATPGVVCCCGRVTGVLGLG